MNEELYKLVNEYGKKSARDIIYGAINPNLLDVIDFKVLPQGCLQWMKGHPIPIRGNMGNRS